MVEIYNKLADNAMTGLLGSLDKDFDNQYLLAK